MIRVLVLLFVSSFQTGREKVSRVGTDLAAKQIQRIAEPEVDVLLNDVERNSAEFAHVFLCFINCAVRLTTRLRPVSPTNM